MQPVRYQPVAPMDLLQRQALGVEVKRHSLAGLGHQRGLVLRVQPAHPYRLAGLAQQQGIARADLPGQGGAGDHDAGAGHGKRPIHGQTETAACAALTYSVFSVQQRLAQRLDALPGDAGQRELLRLRIGSGRQQRRHLSLTCVTLCGSTRSHLLIATKAWGCPAAR